MPEVPSSTVTFCSTDIRGSTRLLQLADRLQAAFPSLHPLLWNRAGGVAVTAGLVDCSALRQRPRITATSQAIYFVRIATFVTVAVGHVTLRLAPEGTAPPIL
jgi:hypothetical protein